MKRVMIFIGLKLVEISAAGIALCMLSYPIYHLGYWIETLLYKNYPELAHLDNIWVCIANGVLGCLVAVLILMIVYLIAVGIKEVIKINWRKAGEIANR